MFVLRQLIDVYSGSSRPLTLQYLYISSLDKYRVRWEDNYEKCGIPIPYDGTPFFVVGVEVRECQFGGERQKLLDKEGPRLSCPALIRMRVIIQFPEYKVEAGTEYTKTKQARRLKEEFSPSTVQVLKIYVKPQGEHSTHVPVTDRITSLDPKVSEKIHSLVAAGYRNSVEIRRKIAVYVQRDLGIRSDPQTRRFCPTSADVKQQIRQAQKQLGIVSKKKRKSTKKATSTDTDHSEDAALQQSTEVATDVDFFTVPYTAAGGEGCQDVIVEISEASSPSKASTPVSSVTQKLSARLLHDLTVSPPKSKRTTSVIEPVVQLYDTNPSLNTMFTEPAVPTKGKKRKKRKRKAVVNEEEEEEYLPPKAPSLICVVNNPKKEQTSSAKGTSKPNEQGSSVLENRFEKFLEKEKQKHKTKKEKKRAYELEKKRLRLAKIEEAHRARIQEEASKQATRERLLAEKIRKEARKEEILAKMASNRKAVNDSASASTSTSATANSLTSSIMQGTGATATANSLTSSIMQGTGATATANSLTSSIMQGTGATATANSLTSSIMQGTGAPALYEISIQPVKTSATDSQRTPQVFHVYGSVPEHMVFKPGEREVANILPHNASVAYLIKKVAVKDVGGKSAVPASQSGSGQLTSAASTGQSASVTSTAGQSVTADSSVRSSSRGSAAQSLLEHDYDTTNCQDRVSTTLSENDSAPNAKSPTLPDPDLPAESAASEPSGSGVDSVSKESSASDGETIDLTLEDASDSVVTSVPPEGTSTSSIDTQSGSVMTSGETALAGLGLTTDVTQVSLVQSGQVTTEASEVTTREVTSVSTVSESDLPIASTVTAGDGDTVVVCIETTTALEESCVGQGQDEEESCVGQDEEESCVGQGQDEEESFVGQGQEEEESCVGQGQDEQESCLEQAPSEVTVVPETVSNIAQHSDSVQMDDIAVSPAAGVVSAVPTSSVADVVQVEEVLTGDHSEKSVQDLVTELLPENEDTEVIVSEWRDLFDVAFTDYTGYVSSMEKAEKLILKYELLTTTQFCGRGSCGTFGITTDEEYEKICKKKTRSLKLAEQSIRRNQSTNPSLEYFADGIPYVFLNRVNRNCLMKRSAPTLAADDPRRKRRMARSTKHKSDCNVKIMLRHIVKFPQYKVNMRTVTDMEKRQLFELVKDDLVNDRENVVKEHRLYVDLPRLEDHDGHPVGKAACTIQRLDRRIIHQIGQLVKNGIRDVAKLQKVTRLFALDDLLRGFSVTENNTRFFPGKKSVRNCLNKFLSTPVRDKSSPRKKIAENRMAVSELLDQEGFSDNNDESYDPRLEDDNSDSDSNIDTADGDVYILEDSVIHQLENLPYSITRAVTRMRKFITRTPMLFSQYLSTTMCNVYIKLESEQLAGSFMSRGAYNKLLMMAEDQTAQLVRGVVTANTRNFGLACVYAAKTVGCPLQVFCHISTDSSSIESLQTLGAKVKYYGLSNLEAEEQAKYTAERKKMTYLSPYNDIDLIAGFGTIGQEIYEELPDLDCVLIPVGCGALIGGITPYLKSVNPAVQVIGCQAQNAKLMLECIKVGKVLYRERKETLATALSVGIEKTSMTFAVCNDLVDDWLVVGEDQISRAIYLMHSKHHKLVDGASGVAIAAYMSNMKRFTGKKVVIVASGCQISSSTVRDILIKYDPQ